MKFICGVLFMLFITYCLLSSFKVYQKILIMIILAILIAGASYGLTMHGIDLYTQFHDVGNAGVFIGAIIMMPLISEAVLLPIFSYIINKYNIGKIGPAKFVIKIVAVILIFTVVNILIYL